MKTVFIIGGIGSGKSTVSHLFAEAGFPVLDLDKVGHAILYIDEAIEALTEAFGADIMGEDAAIDRKKLAGKAFVSPEETARLNSVLAPYILAEMRLWLSAREKEGCPVALVEVSAYDGPQGDYGQETDYLIAVLAPEDVRIQRALERGFTEDDVRHRIARQATDEQRREWANFVIENEGSLEDVRFSVESVCQEISKM